MSEEPVLEKFFPVLIQSYIRLMTVVSCIKAEEAGGEYVPRPVRFSIAKDLYRQLRDSELDSPLFGLHLDYDEKAEILTVEAEPFVLEWYSNKIMREVALKQAGDFKNRYSHFIKLAE